MHRENIALSALAPFTLSWTRISSKHLFIHKIQIMNSVLCSLLVPKVKQPFFLMFQTHRNRKGLNHIFHVHGHNLKLDHIILSLHPSVDIPLQSNQFICMHECCHSIKDSQSLLTDVSNLITSLPPYLFTHQLTLSLRPFPISFFKAGLLHIATDSCIYHLRRRLFAQFWAQLTSRYDYQRSSYHF